MDSATAGGAALTDTQWNDAQALDIVRGAKVARDEYGLERLYEHVLDAVETIERKDQLINRLLDRIEKLEAAAEPAEAA